MDWNLVALFVVTLSVAMIVPGPDMLFVLGIGARGGPRAGLLATCGVATGEAMHIVLAAVGLAALFAAAPAAFLAVKVAGAIYLVLLGIQTIRGARSALAGIGGVHHSYRRAYLGGVLTNLLNPKMVTFTIAFLPQFVDHTRGHVALQFAVLGVIFLALEFVVDGTVGVLAGRIGRWLRERGRARRGVEMATGGLFIGLGVRLATER